MPPLFGGITFGDREMKFEEVLPAFREGKKIRRRGHIWFDNSDEDLELTMGIVLNKDDWEILDDEPKKIESICRRNCNIPGKLYEKLNEIIDWINKQS